MWGRTELAIGLDEPIRPELLGALEEVVVKVAGHVGDEDRVALAQVDRPAGRRRQVQVLLGEPQRESAAVHAQGLVDWSVSSDVCDDGQSEASQGIRPPSAAAVTGTSDARRALISSCTCRRDSDDWIK